MSTIYICAVSPTFPENYEIGVRTGTWGVTANYRKKILRVKSGDKLVFLVAGSFRSIHEVTSAPYEDHSILWPPRDGDVYPHRIRIGPSEASGNAPVRELAARISFMRGKVWGGTVKGANGVFNDRATKADLELIRMALLASSHLQQPPREAPALKSRLVAEPGLGLENLLDRLAALARLSPAPEIANPFDSADSWSRGLATGVYLDSRRVPTVAVASITRPPSDTVLSTLYGLSSLKQSDSTLRHVGGKIFTHAHHDLILPLISGVPNLDAVPYELRASLRS